MFHLYHFTIFQSTSRLATSNLLSFPVIIMLFCHLSSSRHPSQTLISFFADLSFFVPFFQAVLSSYSLFFLPPSSAIHQLLPLFTQAVSTLFFSFSLFSDFRDITSVEYFSGMTFQHCLSSFFFSRLSLFTEEVVIIFFLFSDFRTLQALSPFSALSFVFCLLSASSIFPTSCYLPLFLFPLIPGHYKP